MPDNCYVITLHKDSPAVQALCTGVRGSGVLQGCEGWPVDNLWITWASRMDKDAGMLWHISDVLEMRGHLSLASIHPIATS